MADNHGQAQREVRRETKIGIITILLRRVVSEIKLKRTDTTLDLSQKAKRAKEKKKKVQNLGGEPRLYTRGRGSVHVCEFARFQSLLDRALQTSAPQTATQT